MTPVSLVDRPMLQNTYAHRRRADARWLITFADLAAVMVAFFVLLFAMTEVDSDKWDGATTAFDRQFRIAETTVTPRPVEQTNTPQRDEPVALDLGYLERIIDEQLKAHANLREVRVWSDADRLVVDFPGALIFGSGRVGVSKSGLDALFALGGIFAGVDNQVVVVADALLVPDDGIAVAIDWQTALVRAARVARSLRTAGYARPIVVQGRNVSARDAVPPKLTGEADTANERRIKIIVLGGTGQEQ